jgi:hypothetical protein
MAMSERLRFREPSPAPTTPKGDLVFSANFSPLDLQKEGASEKDIHLSNSLIPTLETKIADQSGHINAKLAVGIGGSTLVIGGVGGFLIAKYAFAEEQKPAITEGISTFPNTFNPEIKPLEIIAHTPTPTPKPSPTEIPTSPTPTLKPSPTPEPTLFPTATPERPTPTPTDTPIPPTPEATRTPEPTPKPLEYVVRPVLFASTDTVIDPEDIENINNATKEIQQWLAKQLNGKTFKYEPAILVRGNHDLKFYCPKSISKNQCVHDPGKPGVDPSETIEKVISAVKTQQPELSKKGQVIVIYWANGSDYSSAQQESPDNGNALVGELELDALRKRYNKGTYRGSCHDFTYSIVVCRADPRSIGHETLHAFGLVHPKDDGTPLGDAKHRSNSIMELCEWIKCILLDSPANPEKQKLLQSRFIK